MTRNNHVPKDIKDMEDMFYNPARSADRKKYESFIQGKFSKNQEEEIKKIFEKFGKCEKISELSNKKTFDFKVEKSRLLIEVTSVNPPLAETSINSDLNHVLEKIKAAIFHAEEKDSSEFPTFIKGCVIYCSSVFIFFVDLWALISNVDFVRGVFPSGLDYLIFIPENASINEGNTRELYPPMVFVRNKFVGLFQQNLPTSYRITNIE